jgi:hypothetical protein
VHRRKLRRWSGHQNGHMIGCRARWRSSWQNGRGSGIKQLSSCGIGLFLANTSALLLKCMASRKVLAHFRNAGVGCTGGEAGAMVMRVDGLLPVLGIGEMGLGLAGTMS